MPPSIGPASWSTTSPSPSSSIRPTSKRIAAAGQARASYEWTTCCHKSSWCRSLPSLCALGNDLHHELLWQQVVHSYEALACPAAAILFEVGRILELGDGDVVDHEAGPIDGGIGHVFKTQLDLLA